MKIYIKSNILRAPCLNSSETYFLCKTSKLNEKRLSNYFVYELISICGRICVKIFP